MSTIIEDENVLQPRKFLTLLNINGTSKGFYIAEEHTKNDGSFEGLKEFDGSIFNDFKYFINKSGLWPSKNTVDLKSPLPKK